MKANPESLLPFLKGAKLFAGLDESTTALLARVSHVQSYVKGSMIFGQDDCGEAAYIVRSGVVNIIVCTVDGRELVINEMRAGDHFGELALLTRAPRSASAIAATASEVVVIPREMFLSELERQPKLLRGLLTILAEQLRASADRESALAFLDAPTRLARALLEEDRAARRDGFISTSQQELAQRIGATRQTTAKILGEWRRKGWIMTGRGRLIVLDHGALRKLGGDAL